MARKIEKTAPKAGNPHVRDVLICAALIIVTLVPFWQVRHHTFINYDDDVYVYENKHVVQGLNAETVAWAFTGLHEAHWHPLTSLTHLLDVSMFGLNPAGHHLVNLFLHLVNTALLYLLLRRMTGAVWRSAFVALLFAVHPLHVEPVAWVSSRKDLLSTFFLFLTLYTYTGYTRTPGWKRYVPMVAFGTAAVLSKTVLVTLPFILLLLDYWPLRRVELRLTTRQTWRTGLRLIVEKLPLFIPVLASGFITYRSASVHAMGGSRGFHSFDARLYNSTLAYGQYLWRMVWPRHLAAFYPHPGAEVSMPRVLVAALFLLTVTGLALWWLRRRPYVAAGWFWYLGTLFPAVGIVQSIHYATADRYTYVPLVGIFVIIAWGIHDAMERFWPTSAAKLRRPVLAGAAALLTLVLMVLSYRQAGLWRDSETLARHTVGITESNAEMHNNLGMALVQQGRLDEAMVQFQQAAKMRDYYGKAHYNLGVTLARQGKLDEALDEYAQAIKTNPQYADAYYNMANALVKKDRVDEALENYRKAITLLDDPADAHFNLAKTLLQAGQTQEAVEHLEAVLEAKPTYPGAHNHLGIALAKLGKAPEALAEFDEALRIDPRNADAYVNKGVVLTAQGKVEEAVRQYAKALEIDPANATARRNVERIRAALEK